MATINDRETVDKIIAGNGIYPGDESYPIVKIVQYENAFNGGIAFGLVYRGDPLDEYTASPFVNNPKTIWEHDSVKKPERAAGQIPTIEDVNKWMVDGVAEALDGCEVEPDGYCEHGKPSWMIRMGLI